MLPGPLLIATYRYGKVYPHKLKLNSSNIQLAAELIQLNGKAIGERRSEIEAQTAGLGFEKVNPKVIQGLQKILFDRSTFTHATEQDPEDIREEVFTASAEYWKNVSSVPEVSGHKKNILQELHHGSPEHLTNTETWLFGDIIGNQKLISFETLSPEDLIHRFNIGQVQGQLLKAQDLEIKIQRNNNAAFRQVMHMLKFFRLMFEIREFENDLMTIGIDGPGAVLENRRSYGLEIAQFFPAILLMDNTWQLTAHVKRSPRARKSKLELTNESGYQSYYTPKRIWQHQKIAGLINRINEKFGDSLKAKHKQTIVSLKDNRYLLPDFVVQIKAGSDMDFHKGSEILVEWIPYLSDSKVKWLKKIYPELPANYVFAVKGKRTRLKALINKLGDQLMIFATELTAPAVKKQVELLNTKL
jgi:uncharacterized protein